jgi:transposase-like protein
MGQVLQGRPRPRTPSERRYELTRASIAQLSRTYGVNPKTVAKWKRRTSVEDHRTGPHEPRSSSLRAEQEAVVVAFRRHTRLPLDDRLYVLQATIPHLTRCFPHRCLSRHGISRLSDACGDKPVRRRSKSYPIGTFHIDIAEVDRPGECPSV